MPAASLETDFLVIGAGVAGLRAAIELAPAGRVLVLAKRIGILAAVEPVLQQLENDAGFRLAPSLKLDALRAVGEV